MAEGGVCPRLRDYAGSTKGESPVRLPTPADWTVRPGRLPQHETVYAMTVHNGQGSAFDDIGALLPDGDSPVPDRPLVYTAITRARRRVRIPGGRALFEQAVWRVPDRSPGLRDALENAP